MAHKETECIEICSGDKLLGYAIFFSGGWDAYKVEGVGLSLVGRYFTTRNQAIRAVTKGHRWLKP